MNKVSGVDVTFLTTSLSSFGMASAALSDRDFAVAGGFALLGIICVYLYHKFGSPTM